jgi:hypothetical protein
MTTIELRRGLTKKYWRSVLWIDDEIKPAAVEEASQFRYLNFFIRIANEFAQNGIICHLKEFQQVAAADDGDPYSDVNSELTICQELSKQADILILDWQLGSTEPTHAVEIINELIKDHGNRIIIVLSKEEGLSDSFSRIFGQDFNREEEWLHHKNGGIYVLLLSKVPFQNESAINLYETIYTKLSQVYPDYLHWTAIEIAGRIKSHTHSWLANLPMNTDLAILGEALHNDENVGVTILENLFEDLKESAGFSDFKTTEDSHLTKENWIDRNSAFTSLSSELDPKRQIATNASAIEAIEKVHPLIATEKEEKIRSKVKAILKNELGLSTISEFIKSICNFGAFCEVISNPQNNQLPVRRGSVFRKKEGVEPEFVWVCISQSCDCAREKNLLFLKGVEANDSQISDPPHGSTFLQLSQKKYIFISKPENLISLQIDRITTHLPNGFDHINVLREVMVAKLSSRYWSFSTRVGIDQPLLLRSSRGREL